MQEIIAGELAAESAGDNSVSPTVNIETMFETETPVEADPNLQTDDLIVLLSAELMRRGIAGDHLRGMNTLYTSGLKQILTKIFKVEVVDMKNERDAHSRNEEDQNIDSISFNVAIVDIEMKRPTINKTSSTRTEILTPNMCRLRNLSYSAPIYVTADVTTTAKFKDGTSKTRVVKIGYGEKKWRIGSIPVMVKSVLCHLFGASRETVKQLQEDPNDEGGYFILRGREWAVDKSENLVLNLCHGYLNNHGKEVARVTFQSKPGDAYENSYYMEIKLLVDHQIVIKVVTNKTSQIEIPFYMIFRAFGMSRDREIVDHIVYGYDNTDPVTAFMLDKLERAFEAPNKDFAAIKESRTPEEVLHYISAFLVGEIATHPKLNKDPNAVKYVNTRILTLLDKFILPHIGSTREHRIQKLRFIGHIIHKLLRIAMGVLVGTDRDNVGNKRFHTAGIALGKTLKTQINFAVINEIRKGLNKAFKNTQWSKVDLENEVRRSVKPDDLERAITQSIVTGEKTLMVRRTEIVNRVSSQALHRKNSTNVAAILNNITTHGGSAAKVTDRATDMRMVHNSQVGYEGVAQSADTGEKVGMNKQQAIGASITEASSSYVLKDILKHDPDILHVDKVEPGEISARALTKVFVNGDWIGLAENGPALALKYRTARRYNIIWHEITIFVEYLVREIYFWTDAGRMLRPLVIVYNNIDEVLKAIKSSKNPPPFKQWIKLTRGHIKDLTTGATTMEKLRDQRVIEYISPEESQNMLIARNLDVFVAAASDITHQYTHVDIEQSIFGIVELSAPNSNHTPASRITMFTNHKKQTCGWYALNHPFRMDRLTFLQYYCETPTVKAFSNAFVYPNSQNVILAYTPHIGYGQEDSIHINKSSVDLGLFTGSHYYYEQTELERGERFGNPDRARTIDIQSNANYSHIDENGFVREGTIVQRGDVLVVKSANLPEPMGQYIYADRSLVYNDDEPSIVEWVIYPRNDDDVRVAKVKLRSSRPIRVGDKLCVTPDHEVLTDIGWTPIASITPLSKVATLNPDTNRIEWHHPIKSYSYTESSQDLLTIESPAVSTTVTFNHRLYTNGKLVPAIDVFATGTTTRFGLTSDPNPDYNSNVWARITLYELIGHTKLVDDLEAEKVYADASNEIKIVIDALTRVPDYIFSEFSTEAFYAINRALPDLIYESSDLGLLEDIQRIAWLNGVALVISHGVVYPAPRDTVHPEEMITTHTTTSVHCLEVPNNIFAVRRRGRVHWTGNSSHAGCKGINAIMLPRSDMPYCIEDGVIPDVILNPHSVPTRMVIGQIIETMMAELAVRRGVLFDGTPFRKLDIDGMIEELATKYKVNYGGHRRMYNGKTGNYYDALIFIGPTAYQRLQKFVIDENYAMSNGPTCALTRQPLDGRAKNGGLRIGEMEKDAISSHGVMRMLFTKLYIDSDGIDMFVCRCGNRAIVNEKAGIYKCRICKDDSDIVSVPSSWVANLLYNQINAMGVKTSFKVETLSYSSYN